FTGKFCESSHTTESTCEERLQTKLNDVALNNNIMDGGCGCTEDMSSCSWNRVDPCDNRCSSDSTCQLIDNDEFTESPEGLKQAVGACVCNAGFEGEFCDRKDLDCSGKPCQNGAECVHQTNPDGFVCICGTGYTGELCDIPIGLCAARTCENGGTCFNLDPLSTFCLCQNGYAGERCERLLDLGCFNKGDKTSDGSCQCKPPWEGRYCTLLKDPMPIEVCGCNNGATCVYDESEGNVRTSCTCPQNFVGEQ
ncbi:hypothetical protein PMAYCL1PPCAC_11618, partial [Pristionchus mayeri]